MSRSRTALPAEAFSRWWRTISTSFWLGWKIESNWADPFLFTVYALLRPVAAALILVFMYRAVTGLRASEHLAYLVVGMAFWPFVLQAVQGTVRGHLQDREHFRTLRQIYTAPIVYRAYLVGRGLALMTTVAVASATVTLLIGVLFLDAPIALRPQDVPALAVTMIFGVAGVLAVGMIAASFAVAISGEAWQMPDGIAAGMYLICGTIFPVQVLPSVLEAVAKVLPITWWLESLRRVFLAAGAPSSFPWASDGDVLVVLVLLSLLFVLVARVFYGYAETRARRRGIFDEESGY